MADISRDEKALAGLGLSASAAGLTSLSGAASGSMLATGISNAMAVAPGLVHVGILGGKIIAAVCPVVVPVAIVGGLVYAGYQGIRSSMDNNQSKNTS